MIKCGKKEDEDSQETTIVDLNVFFPRSDAFCFTGYEYPFALQFDDLSKLNWLADLASSSLFEDVHFSVSAGYDQKVKVLLLICECAWVPLPKIAG